MKLPETFRRLIESYHAPQLDGLIDALETTRPETSIRYNPLKSGGTMRAGLPVAWWPEYGRYLSERPAFTFDPARHQGIYYVQDASSMSIAKAVRHLAEGSAVPPAAYLDACAAPGGKTTAALDALPPDTLVVANEYDFRRANILAENVAKWGRPGVIVTRGDTARLSSLRDFFDIISADVPCSGEGMMRKDADAVNQWTPALVAECAARQRQIIDNLWPALRPGGFLIYSTCTFNRRENEEIIDYIIAAHGAEAVALPFAEHKEIAPGIDVPFPCYRFIPGRTRGEGLFIAALRKPHGSPTQAGGNASQREKSQKGNGTKAPQVPSDWLDGDFEYFSSPEGEIHALPSHMAATAAALYRRLDIVSHGTHIATAKGRDIIPAQPLALCSALGHGAFPRAEISRTEAIAYLRRETVALSEDSPRGHILLTHSGIPLGFVKNLGNRSNNLYPPQWRILSTHRNK